jgi:hypothetical protein
MTLTDAEKFLRKCLSLYANCRHYSCHAVLKQLIQTENKTQREILLNLCFSRPDKLFCEWWPKNRDSQKRITLANGQKITRHFPSEFLWEDEPSIEQAVAGEAGVSAGLVLYMAGLLNAFPGFCLFESITNCELNNSDSNEYVHISGLASNSIKRILIIRKSDLVITQLSEEFGIINGSVLTQIHFSRVSFGSKEAGPSPIS